MPYKGCGGRFWITFNGEIYNYLELKGQLIGEGYIFESQTDTEVILAAYDAWGDSFVTRFNGMWALAIYDQAKRRVFLSRDRFGIKPLYFCETDKLFAFGSEIKQLLDFLPKRKVNRSVLADYLALNFLNFPGETFFEGVRELKPSHNLVFDLQRNEWHEERYYKVTADSALASLPESEAIRIFRDRLDRSIELRLRSDVKVGTCLSGGQDSSAVSALASSQYKPHAPGKFAAITAVSGDPRNDEREYAELVARHCDLDWHPVSFDEMDQSDIVDKLIWTQEEPFPSPSISMQYLVFRKAAEIGCKVMLDGQGGDESLVGYEYYYPTYLTSLPFLQKVSAFLNIVRRSKLSAFQLLQHMVYRRVPLIRRLYARLRGRMLKRSVWAYVRWQKLKEVADAMGDIRKLQAWEVEVGLGHLLRYEDRNSMANSVEGRVPLLDYKLVEMAVSLPNNLKVKDGWSKYILRKATENALPPEIAWRKSKIGFEPPRNAFRVSDNQRSYTQASPLINHVIQKYPANNNMAEWKLYIVAKWAEVYDVSW